MADKIETIKVLPHPFDRDGNEQIGLDSRIADQVQGRDVWKLTTTVSWSNYPNNTLSMPRTSSDKPPIGDYQVELNRGNAKRGKDGSGNDYDYYWNAISWKLLNEEAAPEPIFGDEPTAPAVSAAPAAPASRSNGATADERRDRSVAISYAKDAWCAGKIERTELFELAEKFHDAMVNGFTVEDEEG